MFEERERLNAAREERAPWKLWGPYLSERQWGTVREDYSASGDAWASFPHEHARSRAYRWGEDGLLGIADEHCFLCLALALWNGRDPILKERLFGLTNPEGNHGEDVKECYYYLDALPTASYLKGLYKYPQAAFPYQRLLDENRRRTRQEPEYELLETGVFDGDRYFDVFVEYAKAGAEDILLRLTLANRGPQTASLHVLPTLWFRNTWSWKGGYEADLPRPTLRQDGGDVVAEHARLGRYRLKAGPTPGANGPTWLFTENETNYQRLYGTPNASPYTKDAFHEYVCRGRLDAVNPAHTGTKAAAHYLINVPAGGQVELRLRLRKDEGGEGSLGGAFEDVFGARRAETDEFYRTGARSEDTATLRQACAGLIWSKQFYYYAVSDWLDGDPILPPPAEHRAGRNHEWRHVFCRDIISMPDKWEFPWFAAWDLAFQAIPFIFMDRDFAREQLLLMLREWYMNPNGQLAAYEYNFGDVNPPVHAFACRQYFRFSALLGQPDFDFLKRVFLKLSVNFTWWVNRKDSAGTNLFGGGFLGLDNIGVFDRSMALPGDVKLEQADGTAWMGMFAADMLDMALTLAVHDPAFEDIAVKFFEHFLAMKQAIGAVGGKGLWNEEDGFYYDRVLVQGRAVPLRLRSIVGVLPILAAAVLEEERLAPLKDFTRHADWFLKRRPELGDSVTARVGRGNVGQPERRWLFSFPSRTQLERVLRVVFDERELLSPYGIRSLSRAYRERPFVLEAGRQRFDVRYLPGESDTPMFGGNSNWRGPVWFPVNAMLTAALRTYHRYYGDDFKVEVPTGSGRWRTLEEAADDLTERLLSIFRPDAHGRRPCHGDEERYAKDPYWKNLILFNEYFHGDNGRGCGASHQTGWTGLAAVLAWQLARARERQER